MSKATSLLAEAFKAAPHLHVDAVLILPEGPNNWPELHLLAGGVRTLVALSADRQIESARAAGLTVVEVEQTDAAITERIALALIEAVANDHLSAGDRVVVVYSGFESDALDSLDGRPTRRAPRTAQLEGFAGARDLGPVRDVEGRGRRGRRDRPRRARREHGRNPGRGRRRPERPGAVTDDRASTPSRGIAARSATYAIRGFARRSRRSRRWMGRSSWRATGPSRPPAD